MPETAREYLIHRFRGDAHSLRERMSTMQRGANIPGPDAATSGRMADACDAVVHLLEGIGAHDDMQSELAALVALIPQLDERAKAGAHSPPVRAVYAGAATRIREVEAAEARAGMAGAITGGDVGDDEVDAEDDDDHDDA